MKRRGRRVSASPLKVGVIAAIVTVIVTYLGFTRGALPFTPHYEIKVVFANANGLRPDSFVRIAGINVGKVKKVEPAPGCKTGGIVTTQCTEAVVTMQIKKLGLPIHKDATFNIRPRIFLEGNYFVDLHPGSPSAPIAASGYVFPMSQGTEPVQFDQVTSALPSDTRRNLQILLQQYGSAVHQAGPSYNSSIQFWLPAYKYTAIVTHDALGEQPHDLSNWIAQQGTVSGAFDAHPQNLENLITEFNQTARAFAVQQDNLQRTVAELPKTLSAAIPAFNSLNAAFPPTEMLALKLKQGVITLNQTIPTDLPFITQLKDLVQPTELGNGCAGGICGLTYYLKDTVPALAHLVRETIPLMKNEVRPASSCVVNEVIPWSHLTLNDPHFNASNGFPPRKVYVEAVDFLPGLAGESRDFDANGPYIRILGALGNTVTESLQSGLVGSALTPIVGEQPKVPSNPNPPPLRPNVPCETQPPVSNLTAGSETAPQPLGPTSVLGSVLGSLPNLPLPTSLGLPAGLGLSRDSARAASPSSSKSASPSTSGSSSNSQSAASLWNLSPAQKYKLLLANPPFGLAGQTPPSTAAGQGTKTR